MIILSIIASAQDPSKKPKVRTVQTGDGGWQLLVDEKPYFIKGVVYMPIKIGEDWDSATVRDWTLYDDDHDGRNDMGYQTWHDQNGNDKQDKKEEEEGDFSLMRKMGINTIRIYHIPSANPLISGLYKNSENIRVQYDHAVNKKLLREMYKQYGIRVIMGNYFGSWTVGSGTDWEKGCDYTRKEDRENVLRSIKAMVLDNKDEPYVLMWQLGNENNIAEWSRCNAKSQPEAYASLLQEAAEWIHENDPDHPVAVCDGDDGGRMLSYYSRLAPDLDIVSVNIYRGPNGFGDIWDTVKKNFDRPVFISEWGMFAYQNGQEDEVFQLQYIKGGWKDIVINRAGMNTGNSIGCTVFLWSDLWNLDGSPGVHNPGIDSFWLPTPDRILHEEWFGLVSLGKGKDSLMRQTRKAYDYFADIWNRAELGY